MMHIPDCSFSFTRHASGRHRGSRHGFGRGRSNPFGGDDGAPFGRKLGSNELQLVLLALLSERPAHGYELIRMLEERSGGFYSPSSGMVYPALTYLEEIGHTDSAAEGNRKLYTLTEPGRIFLAERREDADAILVALTRIGGRMAEVREAFSGVTDADPASDALHAARHALKHALRQKAGCDAAEANRIARVLRSATESILKGSEGPQA